MFEWAAQTNAVEKQLTGEQMARKRTGNCSGLFTPTDFIYCMNECSDTWKQLKNAQHVVAHHRLSILTVILQ